MPVGNPVIGAPQAIDFGAVMAGQSAEKDVTVSNTGTAPLIVSQATLAGSS